jgi:hypothetical protein
MTDIYRSKWWANIPIFIVYLTLCRLGPFCSDFGFFLFFPCFWLFFFEWVRVWVRDRVRVWDVGWKGRKRSLETMSTT